MVRPSACDGLHCLDYILITLFCPKGFKTFHVRVQEQNLQGLSQLVGQWEFGGFFFQGSKGLLPLGSCRQGPIHPILK